LVETIAPSSYLAIWGSAILPVGGSVTAGTFSGAFQYCESAGAPVTRGNIYYCPVQPIYCGSSNHRVELRRR
jgi:hypothetical protein